MVVKEVGRQQMTMIYKAEARVHNKVCPYDLIPEMYSKKMLILLFGEFSKKLLYISPRLLKYNQDVLVIKEPLGKIYGGIFQEIWRTSFQRIINIVIKHLLPDHDSAKTMNTLDIGLAMGHPCLTSSQYN